MPPYSTVSLIRIVGRSQGPVDSVGRGSHVGLGGVLGGGPDTGDEEDEEGEEETAIADQIR
ncbi:hypothetical protein GCM10009753_35120 [Streptantibioticus ferralitis]